MVFVYIKIYYAARERARRVINKPGVAKRFSRRFVRANNNEAVQAANQRANANGWVENLPDFLWWLGCNSFIFVENSTTAVCETEYKMTIFEGFVDLEINVFITKKVIFGFISISIEITFR